MAGGVSPILPSFLLLVITVQWFILNKLMLERQDTSIQHQMDDFKTKFVSRTELSLSTPSKEKSSSSMYDALGANSAAAVAKKGSSSAAARSPPKFAGVAATLMYKAPNWFHRRYVVMIQNALMNIPDDWAVQLFVNPEFWEERVLPLHPAMERLLLNPRVLVTPLPERLRNVQKPNQIIRTDRWFWHSMAGEKVFMFGGNGIFCSHGNTINQWKKLDDLDFIGVPFNLYDGVGGDGSTHFFTRRTLILEALEYADKKKYNMDKTHIFLYTLLEMKHVGDRNDLRIASKEDTEWFGGVKVRAAESTNRADIPPPPMVLSGTQERLEWQAREDLLSVCPEIKVIFPSLHEPSCFGSHPNSEKCQASICALRADRPSSGC